MEAFDEAELSAVERPFPVSGLETLRQHPERALALAGAWVHGCANHAVGERPLTEVLAWPCG